MRKFLAAILYRLAAFLHTAPNPEPVAVNVAALVSSSASEPVHMMDELEFAENASNDMLLRQYLRRALTKYSSTQQEVGKA